MRRVYMPSIRVDRHGELLSLGGNRGQNMLLELANMFPVPDGATKPEPQSSLCTTGSRCLFGIKAGDAVPVLQPAMVSPSR